VTTISDDFTRADSTSIGAAWVEVANDLDIFSNTLRVVTNGFADTIAMYDATTLANDHYLKAVFGDANVQYPILAFRMTDGSSPFYMFYVDGNNGTVDWYHAASATGTKTAIVTGQSFGAALPGANSGLGVTVEGTGTSTVIRVWRSPTANAPTTPSLWDGNAPALTLTTDPASPVNTGGKVGFGGQCGGTNLVRYADIWAGDFAGAGGAARQAMHLHRQMRN
jgi:hypothetical protein